MRNRRRSEGDPEEALEGEGGQVSEDGTASEKGRRPVADAEGLMYWTELQRNEMACQEYFSQRPQRRDFIDDESFQAAQKAHAIKGRKLLAKLGITMADLPPGKSHSEGGW